MARPMGLTAKVVGFLVAVWWSLFAPPPAHAWLFHEHAQITQAAFKGLSPSAQQQMRTLWKLAAPKIAKFCVDPDLGSELMGRKADGGSVCVGLSALPAIAADHSCSLSDLQMTLASKWIDEVLAEAHRAHLDLDRPATTPEAQAKHVDNWHRHHANLLEADSMYLSRAEVNSGHFQLPRKMDHQALPAHMDYVTRPQAPANTLAYYVQYHSVALKAAAKARSDAAQAVTALLAESTALHFLEDAFSSGHVVGTDGSSSERMGTHDYYSEHGVETTTWGRGQSIILRGDSFLATDYAQNHTLNAVSAAVTSSLAQFTDIAAGTKPLPEQLVASAAEPDYDICNQPRAAPGLAQEYSAFTATLDQVPKSTLDDPRPATYPKEIGAFVAPGAQAAVAWHHLDGATISSGLRPVDRLQVSLSVGYTAQGASARADDGTFFLGGVIGAVRSPEPQLNDWRIASGLRIHVPFCVFPLLDIPITWALGKVFGWERLTNRTFLCAAQGGPYGLMRKFRTPPLSGLAQVVLARDVQVVVLMNSSSRGVENLSFEAEAGPLQILLPVLRYESTHISERQIGFENAWTLGYSATRVKVSGDSSWIHGVFATYGFESRRYIGSD